MNSGILGLGAFLPEETKTNDWWPRHAVERWEERTKKDITKPHLQMDKARSDAQRIQFEEMAETYGDPFRGSQRRRVAAKSDRSSDFEIAAAQAALNRAGVDPGDIGLVLQASLPADRIHPGNGVLVAKKLGLKRASAITVDCGCSSFLAQASLADAMITTGQTKYALLINSAIFSRLIEFEDPTSVNFGDGAAAAVLGPVAPGYGFLAHAARTKADFYDGVVVMPRDTTKRWYENEALLVGSADVEVGRSMVLSVADEAKEGIETVLRRASLEKKDVTHYYAHQATSFFGPTTRRASGLEHAQTVDTFRDYGNVSAASIMLNLWQAQERSQLQPGANTVLFAIGPGMNWMSAAIKWAGD